MVAACGLCPSGGLHENSRRQLQHKLECANQILKAAMAINNITLAEMEVLESYMEALPKVKNYLMQSFLLYEMRMT